MNENIYTCTFCNKKAEGKSLSFLKLQSDRDNVKLNGTNVALMPIGWDWDIEPVRFTDIFTCGCHKIR